MIASRDTATDPGLVLVDIGNSRVSVASWQAEGGRSPVRHVDNEPTGPVVDAIESLWKELPGQTSRAVVISSVSPPVLSRLRSECQARSIDPLIVIGEEIDPPIDADLPEPEKVGSDRLCAAAAAFDKVQGACVVADFGTALTVDLVADNGVFLGGTIMPGITLCARALHEHTALLPLVEVGAPTEVLGKDTETAIRSGIFAMMVGTLREISERYATQIGKWAPRGIL